MDPSLTLPHGCLRILLAQVFFIGLQSALEYRYGFLLPTDLVSLVYQPSKITKSG